MFEQSGRARIDPDGQQVIDITIDGGYHPGRIVARAGLPLRLVFTRDDADHCSERVVFSAPRLDRRIAPTGTTSIDLPAGPPGEVRFTCGMGRYRGRIELVDQATGSPVARLRDRLGRLTTPTAPPGVGNLPAMDSRPGLSRRTGGPEHHADADADDGEDCQLRTRSR